MGWRGAGGASLVHGGAASGYDPAIIPPVMVDQPSDRRAPAYLYLLYGEDEFSRSEALAGLREKMRQQPGGEFNITEFDGAMATLDEVVAAGDAAPFLADRRMVIVHGLLGHWAHDPAGRGRGRRRDGVAGRAVWEGLLERLSTLPPTTSLVLVEGRLSDDVVARFKGPRVVARSFDPPRGERLVRWLQERARRHGATLEPEAARALTAVTEDLRRLDNELAKLSLACAGTITLEAVQAMVARAEASVFALLDAVAERRGGDALTALRSLYQQGERPEAIIGQLAALTRRLLVVKELSRRGVVSASQAAAHGLNPNALPKLQRQARRCRTDDLVRALARLLEADRALKTGQMDQELAIELAVAELASRPAATFG